MESTTDVCPKKSKGLRLIKSPKLSQLSSSASLPHLSGQSINIDELSQLSGFPSSYLKRELMLTEDDFSISQLRKMVFKLLLKTQV